MTTCKNHLSFALDLKGMKPVQFFRTRTDMTNTPCCVCGKALSDSESVQWLIGPVCRKNNISNVQSQIVDREKALSEFWGWIAPAQLDRDLENYLYSNEDDFQMMANIITAYCSSVTHSREGHSKILMVTPALRAIGYTNLADRLEEDRCKVRVYTDDTKYDDFKIYVPTKYIGKALTELEKYVGKSVTSLVKPNSTYRGVYLTFPKSALYMALYAIGDLFEGERFFMKGAKNISLIENRASYGVVLKPCAEYLATFRPLCTIEQIGDKLMVATLGSPWSDKRVKGVQDFCKGLRGFRFRQGYVCQVPHTNLKKVETLARTFYQDWEVKVVITKPYVSAQPQTKSTVVTFTREGKKIRMKSPAPWTSSESGALVSFVKGLKGRRYDGKTYTWTFPASSWSVVEKQVESLYPSEWAIS